MQLPIKVEKKLAPSQPLQLQIFEQIRSLIADGTLKPGTRLPGSRSLALDLGVSRNTVVLAYERLMSEGYLEPQPRKGFFVAEEIMHDNPRRLEPRVVRSEGAPVSITEGRIVFQGESHVTVPQCDPPVRYDFWVGRPDPRLFPVKAWRQMVNRRLYDDSRDYMACYCEPAGLAELREAIVAYVGAARGVRADREQVVIVSGTQEALNIVARLFIAPGRTMVALENPCYQGAARVFASYGATIVPVPVDLHGIQINSLPQDAAFVYVTPSHQYATGVGLSAERRLRLLEWAKRAKAYIVEDDYDGDFHYDEAPLPAIQSLDAERVIYMGTFSKSLGAGLRMGYIVLPSHLVPTATTIKALMNNCSPPFFQAVLAEFIATGGLFHHLRRVRVIYRARRDRLLDALRRYFGNITVTGAQAGLHVAWTLSEECPSAPEMENLARRHGVGVYGLRSGNALALDDATAGRFARMVMLGYAAMGENEIEEAVGRLALVMAAIDRAYRDGDCLHRRLPHAG